MHLQIHTIEKTLFNDEVEKIIAKTPTGEITILDGHLPIITSLNGPVTLYEKTGAQKTFMLRGGILEVQPQSKVLILGNPMR